MESINCVDGDFVIRERRDKCKEYVLTVRVRGEYRHHEIHCTDNRSCDGKTYSIDGDQPFGTLEQLIGYYQASEVCT